jgi:hypothetical protein
MPSRNRILERKRQQEARKKAKKKSKLEIREPSKQDLEDAKKEEATSKIIKNKPKGGYSRKNTKDPGPGKGRNATLEEDRKKNAPKPKPKPKKKEPSEEDKRIGKELAEQFKKDDAEIAAAKKKEKLKVKGKGPVADGKKYGKHLDKRAADKEAAEKKAWLKKSRNSPAARSGAFSDDERWALQKKHRKSQADRKAGKKKSKKFDPRKGRNQRR